MNKCVQCEKELEQISGKEPKRFCSDKCRKAFKRATTDTTSDKPTSDTVKMSTSDIPKVGTEEYLRFLEKTPLKKLEDMNIWIPNWKRVGKKTREDAELDLQEIMKQRQKKEYFTFQFKGFSF